MTLMYQPNVLISDLTHTQVDDMLEWCRKSNIDVVSATTTDVSDFSGSRDTVTSFVFTDKKSAMLFALKFKKE